MPDTGSAYPPEDQGRRGLFPRRSVTDPAQPMVVVSLERAVEERLDDGLRAIEDRAEALMREVAKEMWRTSGADPVDAQHEILTFLSRDQSIRSLIASSDERFQTLAVRTARFEDVLTDVAEASRATREAIGESAAVIREVAASPAIHGVEGVRSQLEQVERHIASTFQLLDDRDRALVEGIQSHVREHGELIARETTRIVEAMQGYVQSGTEALGRLAQRIEAHAEAFAVHDDDVAGRLGSVIADEIGSFSEQIELTGERIGIGQRDVEQAFERMRVALEARVYGLAQLVRSDSLALRTHVDTTASAQEERMASLIDERMTSIARAADEQVSALTMAVSAMVERQLSGLGEQIEQRLGGVTEVVAQRAAEAADIAVSSTFDRTIERLSASMESIDAMRSSLEDGVGSLAQTSASLEERMAAHVDDRIAALAKLMRADNRVIAQALPRPDAAGEAGTAKQTLRAVKELQASLANDIIGNMDRRVETITDQLHRESQSTVETMAKVAEVLSDKVDRLSVRIDEGYGNDLQVVIERMSDAISAISGIGRARP